MGPRVRRALALLLTLIVTGCGGGGVIPPPPPPPPGTGTISGIVTDTRGGPPLSGATVTVEGTGRSTMTNPGGGFSVSDVPTGTHNLLTTRAGYGASRLQGVVVTAGATTEVRMHSRAVFDPARPVSAPTISVAGLSPGATVSGTISFTINVSAAIPLRRIEWRFGHRGDVPNGSVSDSSSVMVTWNTTLNANGTSFVNIIAYDNNYNVGEWPIPVTISNVPSGSPPGPPASVHATALTFGRPLNVFRAQREAMVRSGRLRQDPNRLQLRDGRFVDIQAAPSDSTLFVYVLWSPVTGATGYKIYRAFSAAGPFTLLADARSGAGIVCSALALPGMTLCHRDSSGDLAAGTTVYYRVTAYTSAGESSQSTTASTTPLLVFNLNLTSPPDETSTIAPGSNPTLTWTPVAVVGTFRYYEGYVWGVNDASTSYYFCTNATSVVFGSLPELCFGSVTPLQRAKRYEWDIWYAYAFTSYASGDAYSMAGFAEFGTFPFSSSGSLNGPFRFTTTP